MLIPKVLIIAIFVKSHLQEARRVLTISSEASSVGLSVLTVHAVGGLGDDETVRVHHRNNVEGELAQVAGDTGIGSSNEFITNVPFGMQTSIYRVSVNIASLKMIK